MNYDAAVCNIHIIVSFIYTFPFYFEKKGSWNNFVERRLNGYFGNADYRIKTAFSVFSTKSIQEPKKTYFLNF